MSSVANFVLESFSTFSSIPEQASNFSFTAWEIVDVEVRHETPKIS